MNTIKLKYGLEEITSRVPGLFPYIEFDENNVSSVHPASDSYCGCYSKIPCSITIPEFVVDDEQFVIPGNTYSYKTLMRIYYQYRKDYPDSEFIKFMDKGIGRFKITADVDFEQCVLVPEYEYYANAARLFDEYTKIGIMCEKYTQIKEITGETNCELECLVEKYAKMGGDTMRDYYGGKCAEAKEISDEYFNYKGDEFSLNFDINMVSSENDLGILTTYVDYFNPNETYLYGETVIHNDRTYVCKVNMHEGIWNPADFDLLSDEYIEEFSSDETYVRGDFVRHGNSKKVYICTIEEGETYTGGWNSSKFNLVKINGTSNSNLAGFKTKKCYLDEGGKVRIPDSSHDWLWYYNKGDIGAYETTTDNLNNIVVDGRRVTTVDDYETHLMAYGDIITNITRDTDHKTIKFNYVIGAHFKAKYKGYREDDDGNKYYLYGDYEYDEADTHGIKFEEVFYYDDGSEIDLMSGHDFDEYINGRKVHLQEGSSSEYVVDTYKKCEFITDGARQVSTLDVNGVPKDYTYITSEFGIEFDNERDYLDSPLTKLDYLVGTTYNPTVKSSVNINRGNAAAWERHIKLGEIRTFDDLETYANGGFFNLR